MNEFISCLFFFFKEREQNKVYLAEINKLKTTLVTVETNAQTMSQLLEQKQNEVLINIIIADVVKPLR